MSIIYNLEWLTNKYENGEVIKYLFFWGNKQNKKEEVGKFCFSQWFEIPFVVDNITYKTAEHWMMAQKAKLFNDKINYEKIILCEKPGEAKELGREVLGFDEQTWNEKRIEIVKIGNIHKFNQNKTLGEYLKQTGNRVLVEASPVDIIWGNGLSQDNKEIENIYAWRGQNLLGFVLMEVRDFLSDFGYFTPIQYEIKSPWKEFPNIEPHDLFWRMGKGEEYLMKFYKFYSDLNEKEKTIFRLSNPEPIEWKDVYK
jgi:ribA/ribD-fused uncharacterized protein